MEFTDKERRVYRSLSMADLYWFTRWMFVNRRGYAWQQAQHHAAVCEALMRVFRGECKRLIINIPPRYSKTEIVKNFVGWSLGHCPDSEFIYTSYSARLAAASSWDVRSLVQEAEYKAIFPAVGLREDSQAKDEWRTTAGGIMYAVGAGGTITGYGAGKHRPGFGGCFPVGTRVWTEEGLLPIDRIVRERMAVKVWSFDYAGRMVLRDVTEWHENPPNDIVRITFDDGTTVECTPDHRFWTDNRGWVRADSLRVDDLLPCVNGGVKGHDDIAIDAQRVGRGSDALPVLPASASGPISDGDSTLIGGQLCAQVGADTALAYDVNAARDGLPSVAAPDLVHDADMDAVLLGNVCGGNPNRVVDRQSLLVAENGDGMDFGLAEGSVPLAVDDVRKTRSVAKIGELVVSGVAVEVANVKPLGLRADKHAHDKLVNVDGLDLRVARKIDAEVTVPVIAGLEHLSRLDVAVSTASIGDVPVFASDATKVADGVQPFISGHRKPVLVERVRHDDVTFCLTVDEYHNFTVESGLVVKNCLLIDDPHKADEARSDVMRQNVIDWFQNTFESRKNSPDTPIILVMQRLHESDLAGWLLAGGNGEAWEHVCLPALQDDGTALWPEKHSIEELRRMEAASPYTFAGQYQQRPAPADGGLFKPDRIEVIDALPAGAHGFVRAWDLASVVNAGDWTAGPRMGKLADGRYVIADMVRVQEGPDQRDATMKATATRDGAGTRISIPQDPGQAGKTQVAYLAKMFAGYRVTSSPESGDKVTRAEPFASQVNVGNVVMVRAPWNAALIDEMRMFPNGAHDDQVDGCSRAFSELIAKRTSYFG